jgi:hypothetical protein
VTEKRGDQKPNKNGAKLKSQMSRKTLKSNDEKKYSGIPKGQITTYLLTINLSFDPLFY